MPYDATGGERMYHAFEQSTWVMRAIKKIAGPIAAVDLHFTRDGQRFHDADLEVFWETPGAGLSRTDLIEATVGWLKLEGEAFWLLDDSWLAALGPHAPGSFSAGPATPIQIARPDRMRHVVNNGELEGWEYVDAGGKRALLLPEQVIQLKLWNPYSDFRGMAELKPCRDAAEADFLAGKVAMSLGHGIELAGRVVDAAGKPVAGATLTRNREWRNPAAALTTDTNGAFNITNLKPGEMYLTIQANGLAGQTRLLTLGNSMPELKIQMAPGKVFQGRVVDPAGKPIAGASVQMDRADMGLGPIEYEWSASTDNQGRFAWDSAPEGEHPYCFSAAGYHPRTEPSLPADGQDRVFTLRPVVDGDITLIEGRVSDADSKAPLTNFTVYVKQYNGQAMAHSRQTFTNADGHYAVSVDSAATACVISAGAPRHKAEVSNMKAVGDGDLRLDFALEGGFAMTGLLYRLEGRLAVSGYDGKISWTNQQFYLSTLVPQPELAATDPEGQRAEFEKFLETPEGRVWQRAHRSYEVEMDNEGAFKIEEVPEGPYQLQINVRQTRAEGGESIAVLSTNFNVPGSASGTNAVMDLGSLDLTGKKVLRARDEAPPFEVKTVDGAPLRLADFRGKYVLLDFWATWCGPCVGETPFLKAAYKAFGANNRFAMISLSLDKTVNEPREFLKKNDLPWLQGYLGEWSETKVAGQYGVEGIPALFLVSPDGKIIESELEGSSMIARLENHLK